jgi:hypothetical protein
MQSLPPALALGIGTFAQRSLHVFFAVLVSPSSLMHLVIHCIMDELAAISVSRLVATDGIETVNVMINTKVLTTKPIIFGITRPPVLLNNQRYTLAQKY